jgi:hypothetical protein
VNDIRPELHGHVLNPLDLVERLAADNDWAFERHSEDELALELKGQWCRYDLWLSWHADLSVLQLACALDLEIPARRVPQAIALLALANEKLLLGHFELSAEERRPAFRYGLLFRDGVSPGPELLEDLIDIAVSECERFYPAFGFVGRGLKSPREALQAAMLETEGEA